MFGNSLQDHYKFLGWIKYYDFDFVAIENDNNQLYIPWMKLKALTLKM